MAIDFGSDPSAPMNCSIPRDQFAHFNDIVDAVHSKLISAAREAYDSITEDPAPWCQKAMAMSSAVVRGSAGVLGVSRASVMQAFSPTSSSVGPPG